MAQQQINQNLMYQKVDTLLNLISHVSQLSPVRLLVAMIPLAFSDNKQMIQSISELHNISYEE